MTLFYVSLPLSPFFLESDVAAISINVHGRAGSSWHLIQDFTNIAGDLYGTFFIHQNKGMFLQENRKKRKKENNIKMCYQSPQ